ncbi:putative bifunctional inhibitor/plant lipid transfer protein/seed storage helical [Arabidopsis thaliana]
MEAARFAVAVVLVFCYVTSSNAQMTSPPSGGAGGDAHSLPCIQKLMPCQPYLHLATPPPATCCMPLNEIVAKDATCLCAVFNNVDMLKSLNLTKENALDLPKACGAKADVSLCKTSAGTNSSSTPPATPKTPPASSTSTGTGSGSTGNAAPSTAKPTSSAPAINFGGLSFASAVVATLFF